MAARQILEDLDVFAGFIAYRHCDAGLPTPWSPVTIVTASVDRIFLRHGEHRFPADRDVRCVGHVTWVGNSSMEVTVHVGTLEDGEPRSPDITASSVRPQLVTTVFPADRLILTALFTMVARDPARNTAAPVNRLHLTAAAERQLFEAGELNRMRRMQEAARSLYKQPPTIDERLLIHELFLEQLHKPAASEQPFVWMEDTVLKNTILCQPQDRNIHQKVFGGLLMRHAYELAWTTAACVVRAAAGCAPDRPTRASRRRTGSSVGNGRSFAPSTM